MMITAPPRTEAKHWRREESFLQRWYALAYHAAFVSMQEEESEPGLRNEIDEIDYTS
jgi:hypothetical protein